MRKETITQHLLRRLDESTGKHSRIAKECGIAQATISRIYLRKVSPRLNIAEPLLAWFERNDSLAGIDKSTSVAAFKARVRVRRASANAPAALSN
jgi:transcriptional regulator with XRE-family HTH domain